MKCAYRELGDSIKLKSFMSIATLIAGLALEDVVHRVVPVLGVGMGIVKG